MPKRVKAGKVQELGKNSSVSPISPGEIGPKNFNSLESQSFARRKFGQFAALGDLWPRSLVPSAVIHKLLTSLVSFPGFVGIWQALRNRSVSLIVANANIDG
jgi:hypothetical protein